MNHPRKIWIFMMMSLPPSQGRLDASIVFRADVAFVVIGARRLLGTYPLTEFRSLLMHSHHLALHAKRVTVMPRDSEILRELIFMWDPEIFLAKGSKQRPEANDAMG